MRFKQVQRFIWAEKNILGLGALKYSCSRREEMFGVTMISTIFLANEKFVKNLLVSMNEWKGQLYIYMSWVQRALLDLTFCVYLRREILILSGNSQGIWKLFLFVATMMYSVKFANTVCVCLLLIIILITFVGKVSLGTNMRDAEKLYRECADQV